MFVFGHLGFGSAIARPFHFDRPYGALLIGTVLPDLIDKPIYYFMSAQIPGTRSFAHTCFFLVALTAVAFLRRSRILKVLAFGVLTHLGLDQISDLLFSPLRVATSLDVLFWPLRGFSFPPTPYPTLPDQLERLTHFRVWGEEILGFVLLLVLWPKTGMNRTSARKHHS